MMQCVWADINDKAGSLDVVDPAAYQEKMFDALTFGPIIEWTWFWTFGQSRELSDTALAAMDPAEADDPFAIREARERLEQARADAETDESW